MTLADLAAERVTVRGDDSRVRFETLPTVDRAALVAAGLGDGEPLGTRTELVYTDSERLTARGGVRLLQ
ncbi:hypothetical protein [Haloarcula brevis]|uniref:hypothetical protein n=1 Tax=Haloarcula brevis TaxID=3111453 RepID=UPI00300F2500